MPRVAYRIVDVFTRTRFAGNPLAVFPDARGIPEDAMQRIARETNLSETTFVLPTTRADCDVRVRIFTPATEIPMAGHPTIGTAFVLDRGDRIVFEEGVGPIPVERVTAAGGEMRWRMTQPRPRFGGARPGEDAARAACALSLDAIDVDPRFPIETAATGLGFLFVPLRSLDALGRVRVQGELWDSLARDSGARGIVPLVLTGAAEVRCRMLGVDGIAEDPATGSAAGPLGAWLVRHGAVAPGDPAHVLVRQGHEIGRPSEMHVEVPGTPDDVPCVRVAGACVEVARGEMEI